jgi:hypothetical protein
MPAIPLHTAGPYVAGAYVAVFLIVLLYVAIMATKLVRMQRTVLELSEQVERNERAAVMTKDGK